MIKEVLGSIDGVAAYPVVVLVLFVAAFVAVTIWAWRQDSDLMARLKRLPLDVDSSQSKGEDKVS